MPMPRVSFVNTGVDTGVPFAETAAEIALAGMPGGVSFCFLPAADAATAAASWSPIEGGRRIVRDRVNPARQMVAPSLAKSPDLVVGGAGSRAVLRATAAAQQHMTTNAPESIKLNGPTGSLLIVATTRAMSGTAILLGSTKTLVTDLVPNIACASTGGTLQYFNIYKGNFPTARFGETTATDLDADNSAATLQPHSLLLTWDGARGFDAWLDGAYVPLAAQPDLAGWTDGGFRLFNRVSTYSDADLGCLWHAPVSLQASAYDGYRGQTLGLVNAEFGVGA